MSSSAGKVLGEGGVVDLGGVQGGEGNRVGWMGGGEGGSCLDWGVREKNITGLMGGTGEGDACFVGEEEKGDSVGERGAD